MTRLSRTTSLLAGAAAATILAGTVALWAWFRAHPFESCTEHESLVNSDNPEQRVVLVNRLCDGIASSDDVSVLLVDRRGSRISVLKYGAAYSFVRDSREATPTIEWEGNDMLVISIKKVAYVTQRLEYVDKVRIETNIGAVVLK
jgi:hypothetical protein